MLIISCPYCGPRDECEFSYGGEAHVIRPVHPENTSDQQWADYLFNRDNTRGLHKEQWMHAAGCRQWFNVQRDTVSYEIKSVYKVGEQPSSSD
jgi:sarcosine oxidase subunit delta